ncbi:MAG: hypothetical protein ACRDHG_11435, partial [Anaerolineales bacterium]
LPVLFALSPVLYLFQLNQADVSSRIVWRPLAISAATGAAVFAISWIVSRRALRAGVLASILVIAFFYYGVFADVVTAWGLDEAVFIGLWTALVALGVAGWFRTSEAGNLGRAMFVVAAFLVLASVSRIALFRLQNPPVSSSDPRLWSSALDQPILTSGEPLPDIYYIVPDDYARTDVLKEYLGYDNSQFIRELESRGFVVLEQGRSPYSDSESNMASALNLDYLDRFGVVLGPDSENALMVTRVLEDNRASRFLESLGYRYVHIDSDNTTFPGDNPSISPIAAPDNLTYLWLRASILRAFGGGLGFSNDASDERFRRSVMAAFDRLNAMPDVQGPKFVFFHTLIPHDPYVFGPQGERVTFPDPSDERLGSMEGFAFYVDQLRFVSQLLLESIDQIRTTSESPPIIILQSDEGFQANTETFAREVMLDIRLKGLSAFYLPDQDVSHLPQNLNNVNTFRYLLDLYFGTQLGMLKNASYAEGAYPYQPVELHVIGDPTPDGP